MIQKTVSFVYNKCLIITYKGFDCFEDYER